jgi:adenylosuccinate lyase
MLHLIVSSFGIIANFSDDMRHLQRTEIAEVGEPFGKEQVGSSTMPQKRNPINFENVKSAWKEFMPRMITVYMDQISEHQRDLSNSLSQRYIPELLVMFDSSLRRTIKISSKIVVDKKNMQNNFNLYADKVIAEPLQILLSFYGYESAHEKIRQLAMESYKTNTKLIELVFKDQDIKEYLNKFTKKQLDIILNPNKYTGLALEKTEKICNYWEKVF